jgi:hypothetical protein
MRREVIKLDSLRTRLEEASLVADTCCVSYSIETFAEYAMLPDSEMLELDVEAEEVEF